MKQYRLTDNCDNCQNLGYNVRYRIDDSTYIIKCKENCIASILLFKGLGNKKNPFNFRNCRSNPFE